MSSTHAALRASRLHAQNRRISLASIEVGKGVFLDRRISDVGPLEHIGLIKLNMKLLLNETGKGKTLAFGMFVRPVD
ncbi:MAG: hypothetical protein H7Z17_06070 [Fuerstia sp.]|nr:hypothetical protein [Fuerstiella sp.]